MPLREWMTPDPITAGPSETVREALQRMRRHRVDVLPVTLGGSVVGVIRGNDILRKAVTSEGVAAAAVSGRPVADFLFEVEPVSPEMAEEEALARMRQAGLASLPVVEGGRLVGMISEADLYGFLLDRVATGSARRPATRAGNQVDVLLRVARDATESLELSTILQEITRHAVAALPIDQSALLLLPAPDSRSLVVHSFFSPDDESPEIERIPIEGTVSGWVALQRRSLKVDDLEREDRFRDTVETFGGRLRSMLSAPLLFRGECLGVLNFWCARPHAYLDSDVELLELIGGHISAAVQSARRVEREQRLVEDLRQANRIKDEFLAVATHDMRNALQGVLSYAKILARKTQSSPDLAELTSDLHESATYMRTLITDLHDLARLGMRAIRLHPARVDLRDLVGPVIDQYTEGARDEGVELRFPDPGPSVFVEADPIRLRQILANLVSNAIKYNRPGGWVEVRWRAEDQQAILEVQDTGVGIKPEHREVIFDLFRRIGSSSKVEGSGLGLTITRELVELHGGRLELESEPGVGSTFRILLPMHRIPEEQPPVLEPLPMPVG